MKVLKVFSKEENEAFTSFVNQKIRMRSRKMTDREKLQLFIDWIVGEHIAYDKSQLMDVSEICMTDLLGVAYQSVSDEVHVGIERAMDDNPERYNARQIPLRNIESING